MKVLGDVFKIVQGNIGLGVTNPNEIFDVNGTIQTSNLRILGNITFGTDNQINNNIQPSAIRKVFYVQDTVQNSFTLSKSGIYGGYASNVQVFVGQNLLSYYNESINDYRLGISYSASTTNYTVTLTESVPYGSIVDITVWPSILPASTLQGYISQTIYQTIDTTWTQVSSSNAIYYSGNVGIGTTTNLSKALTVKGDSMFINGNVGIGTSLVNTGALTVKGDALFTGIMPQVFINGSNNTCGLLKFNTNNISGPATTYSSSGARIVLYDSANGSTNYGHCIGIESGNNWYGTSALGNGHKFYAGGTNTFSIDGSGNLLLSNSPKIYGGSTTSYSSIEFSTTTGAIDIYFGSNTTSRNWRFAFQNDRNVVLYDGASALWNTGTSTSDSNLKTNIVPTIKNATEIVQQLEVVDFSWKEESVLYDGGKIHTGFIAQQIEQYIPDAVYTPPDNSNKLLHKEELVPYLTKALQDALLRISRLEEKIATLLS